MCDDKRHLTLNIAEFLPNISDNHQNVIFRKYPVLRKLFQDDGFYVRPAEDPVTLWAIDLLTREYGVPLDAMQLELFADFAEGTHQEGRLCWLLRISVPNLENKQSSRKSRS